MIAVDTLANIMPLVIPEDRRCISTQAKLRGKVWTYYTEIRRVYPADVPALREARRFLALDNGGHATSRGRRPIRPA